MNGPGQLRVRCGGLGGDHDIGAIGGRPEGNGMTDAARAAGDEQGAVLEGHVPAF